MLARNKRRLRSKPKSDPRDACVRLTNETRLREHMHVTTDKGTWRIDFEGEPLEEGCFRLYRCLAGDQNLTEWPEKFAGNPDGMVQIVSVIEAEDARIWGRLSAEIGHHGADLMIAASALHHGAVVVTGNPSDFAPTGVAVENPF